jgi:hypothetical protein
MAVACVASALTWAGCGGGGGDDGIDFTGNFNLLRAEDRGRAEGRWQLASQSINGTDEACPGEFCGRNFFVFRPDGTFDTVSGSVGGRLSLDRHDRNGVEVAEGEDEDDSGWVEEDEIRPIDNGDDYFDDSDDDDDGDDVCERSSIEANGNLQAGTLTITYRATCDGDTTEFRQVYRRAQ